MASRTGMVVVVACAVLLSRCPLATIAAQTLDSTSLFDQLVRTLPNEDTGQQGDAVLMRATAIDLVDRAPTFAHMIESLHRSGNIRLTLRPAMLEALLGRGRYVMVGAVVVGVIEVRPHVNDTPLRARGIAHEFAHAFEIACLQRSDTKALRAALSARSSRSPRRDGAFETRFALEIETAVHRERSSRVPRSTQLAEIARRNGLEGCYAGAAVTAVAVAQ